jgi:hypothetical protein
MHDTGLRKSSGGDSLEPAQIESIGGRWALTKLVLCRLAAQLPEPLLELDTRNKIISAARACELLDRNQCSVVTGYFDPLLAVHARRLKDLAKQHSPLLIALSDPANPIVPAAARAELLAALEVVDYVVLLSDNLVERFAAFAISREEDADRIRSSVLIELAKARQNAC